ncbi:ParA family partition ATPase [Chthonobacter rhizosphaerae]|uniref:ParA family partition ATPase n=1 Tax=Chthonobacter rhizosphaerae TaxID=2735553 RepID=UPI0015EEBD96|nr:ParA family partition ATPase [Chthonobacter rhizosphaerae]
MKTIALISRKGGTGKTTLACHIAVALTLQKKAVALLDLDPQASASEWGDAREAEFPFVQSVVSSRLGKTLDEMAKIGADYVVLDTAPHTESTALDAMRLSDLVLIPCQPSIMDLRAMTKTVELLKIVQRPAYVVMNGVQAHSMIANNEAERTIERMIGLPVCPIRIGERVAYNRCLITGQSAQETEPDGKAAREIDRLRKWIESTIEQRIAA